MAKLTLTSLKCVRANDVFGKDEPRLSVDNRVEWNGSVNKGETVPVSRTVTINGTAQVKLEEMNDNGNNAKQIGSAFFINAKGGNPPVAVFKNAGTHYELRYQLHD